MTQIPRKIQISISSTLFKSYNLTYNFIYRQAELVQIVAVGPPSHGSKVYFLEHNEEAERLAVHLNEDKLPMCIDDDLVIMSACQYQTARKEESVWKQRFESLLGKLSGNDDLVFKSNTYYLI